jgi:hypothetical protein
MVSGYVVHDGWWKCKTVLLIFILVSAPDPCTTTTASFEDDTVECAIEKGTYFSGAAVLSYFICGCMLCCMKHYRWSSEEEPSLPPSKQEHAPPRRSPETRELEPEPEEPFIMPVVELNNSYIESSDETLQNASGEPSDEDA